MQEMRAEDNNTNNEMLHNLRLLRQEMRAFFNNGSKNERAGDKIFIKYILNNRFVFKVKISIWVMASVSDKGHCSELKYKPNSYERGFLRKFLSEEGLVVKSTGKNKHGELESIYHFSGCTIYMNLTPEKNLGVRVISDNKRRAKKTADDLDYMVMIHDLCMSRQGLC